MRARSVGATGSGFPARSGIGSDSIRCHLERRGVLERDGELVALLTGTMMAVRDRPELVD